MRTPFLAAFLLAGCSAAPARLDSIEPLRAWFDAHVDHVRFVALLSPT